MIEVELKAIAGPGLVAVLRNRSNQPVNVLDAEKIQPSRLLLISDSGKTVTPFDERTRQKFDRTVHEHDFEELDPGEEMQLGEEVFERVSPGLYTLRWGPFRFREIPAGRWKAYIVFESRIDRGVDEAGKSRLVPHVWKGSTQSNTVEIRLN